MQAQKYITGGLAVSVGYLLWADRQHRGVNDLAVRVAVRQDEDIRVVANQVGRLRTIQRRHTRALDTMTETQRLLKDLMDVRSFIDTLDRAITKVG